MDADVPTETMAAAIKETEESCRQYWEATTLSEAIAAARTRLPSSSSVVKKKIIDLETCREVLSALLIDIGDGKLLLSGELASVVLLKQIKSFKDFNWSGNLPFMGEDTLSKAIQLTRLAVGELAERLRKKGHIPEPPIMTEVNRRAHVRRLLDIFLRARREQIGKVKIGRPLKKGGKLVLQTPLLSYLAAAGTPIIEYQGKWPIWDSPNTLRSDASAIKDGAKAWRK